MSQKLAAIAASFDLDGVRGLMLATVNALHAWIVDGFAREPMLMAGLTAVTLLPPLSIAGYIVSRLRPANPAVLAEPIRTSAAASLGLGWPRDAWITIEGDAGSRRAVPRELLSIGREDDNDFRLDDASVHRHHAVLHRTPDAHFMICDLSGARGNGLKVNGERVNQVALMDGDRIEVGRMVLMFETKPVGDLPAVQTH
jgi:FHA domain